MGAQLVRLEVTPGENEQIELVVKVPEEPRSIIHGVVKDHCGQVIENAVVKLFEQDCPTNPCSMRPITHTFTDDCGQFLFGPLAPGKHYVIKVWVNDIKVRHMVIKPAGEDTCECDIEKEDDMIEEVRDIIVTGNDHGEVRDNRPQVPKPHPQINRGRPPVKRPRQP